MRLFVWFTALAGLIIAVWLMWGGAWEQRFSLTGASAWLESAGPWGWLAGIGLLVGDLILPVPGTVVMSALGYVYGAWLGGALAVAGAMLSGVCGYGIGRLCGERAARKLLGDLDFERSRLWFARGGGWAVAMSRALPILPEALACTAGLVRMPFGRFVLASLCGSLPMGLLFATIGALGKSAPGWTLAASLLVPAMLWGLARCIHRGPPP